MTKRITDSRIERTTAVLEMIQMFNTITLKMFYMVNSSRDLVLLHERSDYSSLSIKAERLLEMIQEINPAPAKGDCEWTDLNVGDFLC